MNKESPRISLSIGRASDGPRTVGDINPRGMSFSFYLIWLFMAVLNPELLTTFGLGENASSVAATHSIIIYSYLVSSSIVLMIAGALSKRIDHKWAICACILCCGGTIGAIVSAIAGFWLALISGIAMGIGASVFILEWGSIFMRFRFATTVLNSALSFAAAYVLALVFIHWIPTQLSAAVTVLLPLACLLAIGKNEANSQNERLSTREYASSPITSYLMRAGVSLVLFGIAGGALRLICCGDLLSKDILTIDLVLCGGAVVSVVVLLIALITSRRETYWDHMFRALTPFIIACIALLATPIQAAYFPTFFLSMAFVCLEVLVWIFLSCATKDFDMSAIRMFGIGFGLFQIGSIMGVILFNAIMPVGVIFESDSVAILINGADAIALSGVDATTSAGFEYQTAALALILIVAISFAYAALPRYTELKIMMTKTLCSLVPKSSQGSQINEEMEPAPSSTAVSTAPSIPAVQSDSATPTTPAASTMPSSGKPHSTAPTNPAIPSASFGSSASVTSTASAEEPVAAVESDLSTPQEVPESAATNETAKFDEAEYVTQSLPTNEEPRSVENYHEKRDSRGSFQRRCDELSKTYLLSSRESEVMRLLAKGHNAAYITKDLCISRSTAKTHINHIYKKMDIHTQQELLNMVEDRKRESKKNEDEHHLIGPEIDRDVIREAVRRASKDGPMTNDPAQIKRVVNRDIFGK